MYLPNVYYYNNGTYNLPTQLCFYLLPAKIVFLYLPNYLLKVIIVVIYILLLIIYAYSICSLIINNVKNCFFFLLINKKYENMVHGTLT